MQKIKIKKIGVKDWIKRFANKHQDSLLYELSIKTPHIKAIRTTEIEKKQQNFKECIKPQGLKRWNRGSRRG